MNKRLYKLCLAAGFATLFFMLSSQHVFAQAVDDPLPDAAQEAQAREIMDGIRCLVCQNQSIEDSDAELALDLRQIVREQVAAGQNKQQIHEFLLERYGDWILLTPPLKLRTIFLWFGPFVFLVLGGVALYRVTKTPLKHKNPEIKEVKPSKPISKLPGKYIVLMFAGLAVLSAVFYVNLGKPSLIISQTDKEGEDAEIIAIYSGLKAFVEEHPDNLEALSRYADLNMRMGKFGVAANTYGQIYAARPEDNLLALVLQGEATVKQAQGAVTPAARLIFMNVVAQEPDHPAARFYLGMWFLQNGEESRALTIWRLLKAESQDDAPWLPMLNFQINMVEGRARQQAQAPIAGVGFSPSEQDIAEVASMSPEDQQAFIDSMVERLRTRLENNPNDYEGWWRLARVEVQRGNIAAALRALEQAEAYAPAIKRGEISAEYLQLEQALIP